MPFLRKCEVVKSGIPQGRAEDELNEGLDPIDDARHHLSGPVPYEWWYFDASFENGYSAVAIVWPMNYSKPGSMQCTVQLSIYTPEGKAHKHYIFPPKRLFFASYESCNVRVGDFVHIKGTHPTYRIKMEVEGDLVDLVFEAETPGWKSGTAENHLPFPRYNSMGWLVPVPRARVNGVINIQGKIIEVEGHGYHDHNWGEAPFFHLIDNWNWGHIIHGELGIIWADVTMYKRLGYDRIYMFLLSRGGRLLYESGNLDVSYSEWVSESRYISPYPSLIKVSFGGGGGLFNGELRMHVKEVLETQNLLEVVGLPHVVNRLINTLIAKPYYFRWRSQVDGFLIIEGERIALGGSTIHEQMLLRGRRPLELYRAADNRLSS
ncbi:MAG: hypothetical protein JXA49_07635 [Actinobacteria bacterium]|nr:hypothetical protein [Actinomycetota bacterium]